MKNHSYIYVFVGFFALTESSTADIVWSGVQNLSGFSQYVDLNSDSLTDVLIDYGYYGNDEAEVGRIDAYIDGIGINGSNRIMVESFDGSSCALPFGTSISGTPAPSYEWKGGFASSSGNVSLWTVYNPDFPGPPRQSDDEWRGLLGEQGGTYIGIQFDVGGNTHYGWVNITLGTESFHHDFRDPITASWAYESTSNTGIVAGAIPEPSTGILTMGGSLALLYLARARRRGKLSREHMSICRAREAASAPDAW